MHEKFKILMTCTLLFCYFDITAQRNDSLNIYLPELITEQLENIAKNSDRDIDYSDLLESYTYLLNNPVNINSNEISVLRDIYLITDFQLASLKTYKNTFGEILSIYELTSIPGFSQNFIQRIVPFICIEKTIKKKEFKFREIVRKGKHSLLFRGGRILELKDGYKITIDKENNTEESAYLGDPWAYYMRYSFNAQNKLRFGFTMDKDAGELLLKGNLNDSISRIIGNKSGHIHDFLSIYGYAENIGFVKKIIVGDYHLEFGQGLTLWSGLAFGKSSEGISVMKYERGISVNTSSNENRFFRGMAITTGLGLFDITAFYSQNNVDANLIFTSDSTIGISNFSESGLHRTINEIIDKDEVSVMAFGGNLSITSGRFKTGVTFTSTRLNLPVIESIKPYKLFYPIGMRFINFGLDYNITLDKFSFFGELSGNSEGGMAIISGINTNVSDRLTFTFLYHNYGKKYYNFFNNPFAETGTMSNEAGCYLGFNLLFSRRLSMSGYIDFYTFPWLRYNINSSSNGRDYVVQVNYRNKNTFVYLRYRHRKKQENISNELSYLDYLGNINYNDIRLSSSVSLLYDLTLKNRIDFVVYRSENSTTEYGYLIYQDILYRPDLFPLNLTFRYALFSTDSYKSRIYAYEYDVLYSFSVPSYFYSGQRWYLMIRYQLNRLLSLWLRYSRTTYSNRNKIGSGNELINSNHKSEIKAQIKISF